MDIKRLESVSDMVAAEHLFDYPVKPAWAGEFLNKPDHHLLLAYRQQQAVGMISGAELTHPDKGTAMFVNELAVVESCRRQGIGSALVRSLADVAVQRGCYGMWVLTERRNLAAMATYRSAGAGCEDDETMLSWTFSN